MLASLVRVGVRGVSSPLRAARNPTICMAARTYFDASEFLEEKEQLARSIDAKKLPRPIRSKKRFHSPWDPNATNKSFMEFLYWMYTRRTPRIISSPAEAHKYLPIRNVDLSALRPTNETKLTWVRGAELACTAI
jgi:hypothetical protein